MRERRGESFRMGWIARVIVILCGIGCVILAVYNVATPDRFYITPLRLGAGTPGTLVVEPGSPAAKAGLWSGAVVDLPATSFTDRMHLFASAPTGSRILVPVRSLGRSVAVDIPRSNSAPNRYFDLFIVSLVAIFSALVMFRAGQRPLARAVVWLAVAFELASVSADYWWTAPTVEFSFYVGVVMQVALGAVIATIELVAVALLPAGLPRVRRALLISAPFIATLSVLDPSVFHAIVNVVAPNVPGAWIAAISIFSLALNLAMMGLTFAIAESAGQEHRMRALWFTSTISFCWFLGSALGSVNTLWLPYPWLFWVSYFMLSSTLLGPIYATLRHHIVDLNFVISRSAVYGAISLLLLVCFVSVEWLSGKITDSMVGKGFWNGVAAQVLSFAVAIGFGLSLRGVHARVESRVNEVVFRERIKKLRLLESFVQESDLVPTRAELLKVTYEAVTSSIDADEIAVYIDDGGTFVRTHGSEDAPAQLTRSDRVTLQAVERRRPFVSEVPSLHDWYIVPMAVHGTVVGLIACGVKRDRTAYLPDESRVLSDVAQHVATSYALLLPVLTPPDRLHGSPA
ncbi:MAG: hypothetical protein JO322_04550 [Candidatus Eremiobacteraeota bacterium]|nr:hypothetical protein [Candidatus Eremiobacteraeota bacterium]